MLEGDEPGVDRDDLLAVGLAFLRAIPQSETLEKVKTSEGRPGGPEASHGTCSAD
jgi:hypothetical protein